MALIRHRVNRRYLVLVMAAALVAACCWLSSQLYYELRHCPRWNNDFKISPQRPDLLVAGNRQIIGQDNVDHLRLVTAIEQDSEPRWGVAFGPGDLFLAVRGERLDELNTSNRGVGCASTWLWDLRRAAVAEPAILRSTSNSRVSDIVFSPDGKLLAMADRFNLRLWNSTTGSELTISDEQYPPVAFSPNAPVLAYGTDQGDLVLWSTKETKQISVLLAHQAEIRTVAFSPDGSLLASGDENGSIQLWDTRTLMRLAVLQGHTDAIFHLAYSPNGSLLASSSSDMTVRIWDTVTHKEQELLNDLSFFTLLFAPDSRSLTTESGIWDVQTGQLRVSFPQRARTVVLSPKANMVAASSGKETIRFVDIETGRQVGLLSDPINDINDIAFSSDGTLFATTGGGNLWTLFSAKENTRGVLHLWAVPVKQ